MILVCPGDHRLARALCAAGNHFCSRQHLHVVVEFLALGGPVLGALGDEGHVVFICHINWLLRPVPGGLDADVLKPLRIIRIQLYLCAVIAETVGVHCAVQVHTRDPLLVRGKNTGDNLGITNAC